VSRLGVGPRARRTYIGIPVSCASEGTHRKLRSSTLQSRAVLGEEHAEVVRKSVWHLPCSIANLGKGWGGAREKRGYAEAALTPKRSGSYPPSPVPKKPGDVNGCHSTSDRFGIGSCQRPMGKKFAGTGSFERAVRYSHRFRQQGVTGHRQTGHVAALRTAPRGKGLNGCDETARSIRKRERERFANELGVVNGISNENGPMEVFYRIQCAVAEGLISPVCLTQLSFFPALGDCQRRSATFLEKPRTDGDAVQLRSGFAKLPLGANARHELVRADERPV
jgi:hypothetical protein